MNAVFFHAQEGAGITSDEVVLANRPEGRDDVVVQVAFGGGGSHSVRVEGQVAGEMPWATLTNITAAGFYPIARVENIRLVIDTNATNVSAAVVF